MTIGFLLDAADNGKLRVPSEPLSPNMRGELRVRLGVAQQHGDVPKQCRQFSGPTNLNPAKGTVLGILKPLRISTHAGAAPTSPPVQFDPSDGITLNIELDGLDLRLQPAEGQPSFILCTTD